MVILWEESRYPQLPTRDRGFLADLSASVPLVLPEFRESFLDIVSACLASASNRWTHVQTLCPIGPRARTTTSSSLLRSEITFYPSPIFNIVPRHYKISFLFHLEPSIATALLLYAILRPICFFLVSISLALSPSAKIALPAF